MSIIGKKSVSTLGDWASAKAKSWGIKVTPAKNRLAKEGIKKTLRFRDRLQRQGGWTILSYGMGVDSTAIILRLLEDGLEAHGINPEKFVIITSQVGNEFPDLKPFIEKHILPELLAAGIRYIQIARADERRGVYVVLSDTTKPKKLHLEGSYTVRDDNVDAGTIPQSGGEHLCSIKSKAEVLDALIWDITQGEQYAHIIGFEAEEKKRAFKDLYQGKPERIPWYPLIEWDWDRKFCVEYIASMTGQTWVKSACWFCPFAAQGPERDELALRWALFPHLGADALMMEYMALALNPRQTLFGTKSAWSFAQKYDLQNVLASYDHQLETSPWAVYRVRRIWAISDKGKQSFWARGVDILANGTRDQMFEALEQIAAAEGITPEWDQFSVLRAVHADKPEMAGIEHFIAASPVSMVEPKFGRKNFEEKWREWVKKYGKKRRAPKKKKAAKKKKARKKKANPYSYSYWN